MKQRLFLFAIVLFAAFASQKSVAQNPTKSRKSEEIIIRKDDDKTSKLTIEIDGDSVVINGKPLSEYNDGDVSVLKRDLMNRGSQNSLFTPGDKQAFDNFSNDFNRAGPKAFLGVMMNETVAGVQLTDVVKGSSAEKGGLKKGDIITRINNTKISTSGELTETIQARKPGDEVNIYYIRDNKIKDLKVKLGAAENNDHTFMYNGGNDFISGNKFDFKMPPMPKMQPLDKLYNFNFDDENRPKLGMKIEDTENNDGVKVIDVDNGSAADKAGIKKDDMITSINFEKVNSVDEVKEQISDIEDKKTVNVKVMRNGTEVDLEIIIPKKLNSADL